MDEQGLEREPLPDRPWLTSFNGADARSRLMAERADRSASDGASAPAPEVVLPSPTDPDDFFDFEDGFADPLEEVETGDDCHCPAPSMAGYLAAALVGALSLAVIVGGLLVGWNLGQPDEAPVLRRNGSPGLPVAQPAQEPSVAVEPAGDSTTAYSEPPLSREADPPPLEESSIWGSITLWSPPPEESP